MITPQREFAELSKQGAAISLMFSSATWIPLRNIRRISPLRLMRLFRGNLCSMPLLYRLYHARIGNFASKTGGIRYDEDLSFKRLE